MLATLRSIDKANLTLLTERLVLRPLRPTDVTEEYGRGLNETDVNRYLLDVRQHRQTLKMVTDYVVANLESDAHCLFGMFMRAAGRLIGTVRLHNISDTHFSAGVGICVFAKECWGKRYGLEAVTAVVRAAFDQLGLHYLEAGCYEENRASIALFVRAGFEVKAIFRDKYRLENRFATVVFFGLVNPSFNVHRLMLDVAQT